VVAKALLEYYKLGATSLLIRGYDPRPDATQYGEELIPRIRELVADYDGRADQCRRVSLRAGRRGQRCLQACVVHLGFRGGLQ